MPLEALRPPERVRPVAALFELLTLRMVPTVLTTTGALMVIPVDPLALMHPFVVELVVVPLTRSVPAPDWMVKPLA